MERITEKQLERLLRSGKIKGYVVNNHGKGKNLGKNKYGARKVIIDGNVFDSKKEGNRYFELKIRKCAGEIKGLRLQVEYTFEVERHKIASYFADFVYTVVRSGETIVEDVKSSATRKLPVFRLKKKLMMALHGIEIKEV